MARGWADGELMMLDIPRADCVFVRADTTSATFVGSPAPLGHVSTTSAKRACLRLVSRITASLCVIRQVVVLTIHDTRPRG